MRSKVTHSKANIEENVHIGEDVIFAGSHIIIRANARLDTACIIGENVTIGQGAWIKTGAVVLSSIPANAIAEGNPAKVVGYIDTSLNNDLPSPTLIDPSIYGHLTKPHKIELQVKGSSIYMMREISDSRGSLSVGEVPKEVPFSPARYFLVYDVPSSELRGEHAHKKCQQFLICVHGSCRVLLDDGERRCEVLLDRPNIGIFMPEMIWGTQYKYSDDAVLLVFASRPYESDDYIRTYDEFILENKK